MISLDQCLTNLVALTASNEDRPMSLAKSYMDAFVPLVLADRTNGARQLSDLRGQFSRRTEPSPLRNDVLDLLDSRIARLSDPDEELGL